MIGEVFAQHVGRIDGHRTVQVDLDVLQAPSLPQLPEIIEKRLGASNREGGDDNRPDAADDALDDRPQRLGGVGWVMNEVEISRRDNDDVGLRTVEWRVETGGYSKCRCWEEAETKKK